VGGVSFGTFNGRRYTAGVWAFEAPETPVKLVWQWVEKSQPHYLLSFRLNEIPIPPDLPSPPGMPAPRPGEEPHPDFRKGGGELVSRIVMDGKPVSGGSLDLGLEAKAAGGWSAVRWITLPVDGRGTAHLTNLQPGAYRIRPVYHADSGAGEPDPGSPRDTVAADVRAGQTVMLPSLAARQPGR
jgi:hypothetical protein